MWQRLRRWLVLAVLVVVVGVAAAVVTLDRRVQAYLAGPALGGTRVYAAPAVLRPGSRVPGGSLPRLLARLGYRERGEGPAEPGVFRATAEIVEVAQRPSPAPWADAPRVARVSVRNGIVTALHDGAGAALERLEFEPELLAVLDGGGATLGAGADVAPALCRDAVLAAEDRHFFRHVGIDPVAIVRALVVDLRAGSARQGGSTITQQLVKNAFLSPRRTLRRKVQEALLSLLLEARATKEDILERYLTSVYLGAEGGLPIHGFGQAAEIYFGKPLAQLDAAECALLAGMIRSPNRLTPRRHPRASVGRRNEVLALMARNGSLDEAAAAEAIAAPLRVVKMSPRPGTALYVAAEVNRVLGRVLPPEVAHAPGLAVFTTIDGEAQRQAERAVQHGLSALEPRPGRAPLQAALVALDPHSGGVLALVGGRDYGSSPLDRATRARRQPGSAFKPFVYLAALDPARRGQAVPRTVVSPVDDVPLEMRQGGKLWRPTNWDDRFAGTMPIEDALADSRNVATVRLALDVGLDAVAQAALDLGLSPPLPRVPSLALGAGETTLLELTSAYAVFADGGLRRDPRVVTAVTSAEGETLWSATPNAARVLSPGVAYLMTHLLERVVDEGTARALRAGGYRGAAAGKTGTTDRGRDAWFIGYTPDVVAGVWVGRDQGGSGLGGSRAALPIWARFVRALAPPDPARRFPVPEDIVWQDVDPVSGALAGEACPSVRHAPFLRGTAPTERCTLHNPLWREVGTGVGRAAREGGRAIERGGRGIREFFRRLFR